MKKAFTLIELLIVVAIIAILAAIAVPNFLEAQTRSKVSRTLADMRSMKTAMEAYYVDNNTYPGFFEDPSPGFNSETAYGGDPVPSAGHVLSTPIAYMTNPQIFDPFVPVQQGQKKTIVIYSGNRDTQLPRANASRRPMLLEKKNCYGFTSYGPDQADNTQVNGWPYIWTSNPAEWAPTYDPTNGTVSRGDIMVAVPEIPYVWKHPPPSGNAWLPANIDPFLK